MGGTDCEFRNRSEPCLARRLCYADPVDDCDRNEGDSGRKCVIPDVAGKLLPCHRWELLAVTNISQPAKLLGDPINTWENNGARRHRPGQRPATNFVNPRDELGAYFPEGAFRSEIGCAHGVASMLVSTLHDVNRSKLINSSA